MQWPQACCCRHRDTRWVSSSSTVKLFLQDLIQTYSVSFLVVPASPEEEEHQLKQEKQPSSSSLFIITWSPGNRIHLNVVTVRRKRMKSSRKNEERKARDSEAQSALDHLRHVDMFISSALRNRLLSVSFCPSVLVCAGLCWSVQVCAGLCRSVLVCAGLCRSVQVCAGLCWSVQVYTGHSLSAAPAL